MTPMSPPGVGGGASGEGLATGEADWWARVTLSPSERELAAAHSMRVQAPSALS